MQFDDFAKAIGYITIILWVVSIVIVLIIAIVVKAKGSSATAGEKFAVPPMRNATPSERALAAASTSDLVRATAQRARVYAPW